MSASSTPPRLVLLRRVATAVARTKQQNVICVSFSPLKSVPTFCNTSSFCYPGKYERIYEPSPNPSSFVPNAHRSSLIQPRIKQPIKHVRRVLYFICTSMRIIFVFTFFLRYSPTELPPLQSYWACPEATDSITAVWPWVKRNILLIEKVVALFAV